MIATEVEDPITECPQCEVPLKELEKVSIAETYKYLGRSCPQCGSLWIWSEGQYGWGV